MQFGFNLPLSGPSASPAMLARLAAEGEAIGYDYAALSDHIVEPIDIHARYPYSESGEFPAGSRGERHEQLTAIAYLAAKTSRLKFLTSVMVVPQCYLKKSLDRNTTGPSAWTGRSKNLRDARSSIASRSRRN